MEKYLSAFHSKEGRRETTSNRIPHPAIMPEVNTIILEYDMTVSNIHTLCL